MKTKRPILLRWPQRLVRVAAWAVLLTFSANIVTPTLVMARESERRAELMAGPKRTQFDDVTDTLVQLEEALQRMNRRLQGGWEFEWQEIANRGGQTPPPAATDRAALRALEDELDAAVPRLESLQGHVRAYFAQTRKHIEDARLAPEILARHDDSVSEYDASYGQLKSLLHAIKTAHTLEEFKAAVAAGDAFMQAHSSKPKRSTFDPNAPLAFGPGKNVAPEPRTDAKAMRKALGIAEPTAKALARQADAKAAPTAAELAETEDAQFTTAIRAKAQELGNSPVAIYNFVRNNVEFMPTYGSIQGADQTLKTLRGNAFDQSSLLIALLRAANIPARYVYGTIELPVEQVQNWVGGTKTPQAALELLGAGGIPNLGLTQGGVIKKARIEHVWVEAFVDFVPSRGAKNVTGDTWVPLDASFKQYEYAAGVDIQASLGLDADAFLTSATQGATVNEAAGWVQGVDQTLVSNKIASLQQQLKDDVLSADPTPTAEDIVGSKRIRQSTSATLLPASQYSIQSIASRSASLASAIRWKFRFALGEQVLVERSLPQLLGREIAVSYTPASDADRNALSAFVPSNLQSLDDLPASLPTSIARLSARLTIDGEEVATGATGQLGSQVATRKGLFIPGRGWQETENPLTVGEYQAIGLDGVGISATELSERRASISGTKAKLEQRDFSTLDKHNLTGALLQTGLLSYFHQTEVKTRLAADAAGVVAYRLPSYGTLATNSTVSYWFGVPRNFSPNGVLFDMDRMASLTVAKDGRMDKWRDFNKSAGVLLSTHEHSVLEELFNDNDAATAPVGEGMSAIKAIGKAAAAGQRIYTLSSSNLASSLSEISLPPEVKREIADAVGAGRTVVTHQSQVSHVGQDAAGYVIVDEESGSGSYKIHTGADGGLFQFLKWAIIVLLFLIAVVPALAAVIGPLVLFLLIAVSVLLSIIETLNTLECGNLTTVLVAAVLGFLMGRIYFARGFGEAAAKNLVAFITGLLGGEGGQAFGNVGCPNP